MSEEPVTENTEETLVEKTEEDLTNKTVVPLRDISVDKLVGILRNLTPEAENIRYEELSKNYQVHGKYNSQAFQDRMMKIVKEYDSEQIYVFK